MLNFLLYHWYFFILLILILALLDSYLTVAGLKTYQKYASSYVTYQHGYEMNPAFEKQIAEKRWLSWKYLTSLMFMIFSLIILWLVGGSGVFFEFLAGGILLLYISVNMRHLQNILVFRMLGRSGSVQGHIVYSYGFSQRTSAALFLLEAILFAIAGLLLMRPIFWGGVFFCMLNFFKGLRLAKRKFPAEDVPAAP
jgi:hypothetical protein